MKFILALDQGTTSSRAIVFDRDGNIISVAQKEFPQLFPKPGWVEHDPRDIWSSQAGVAAEALTKASATAADVAAIGIAKRVYRSRTRSSGKTAAPRRSAIGSKRKSSIASSDGKPVSWSMPTFRVRRFSGF
jgi:predicted NBD/HSP70 family sugar kinase